MKPLKLLHIADVHLDAPFRWLGSKGKEQRGQIKDTFRAVIDLAQKERVDAILVAGDLFDTNLPSQDTIDLVQSQLRRLDVPVFLLPGTHDCFDVDSIYRRVDFSDSKVHIFDGSNIAFELGALDLTVHGSANLTKTSPASPLAGLAKNPATRFNVALAHGSLALPGAEDDYPLTPAEIAASRMDYLALGHWHSCRDCSTSSVKAFYSGPPELIGEGELGAALLVQLAETGVEVEPRRIGRRRCKNVDLRLDQLHSAEEIRERILGLGDKDLVLSISLIGVRSLDLVFDRSEIARELAESFFSLKVVDSAHPALSPEDMEAFPESQVIGQFVRNMNQAIANATSDQERRMREAALQLGVALLQGKKVL